MQVPFTVRLHALPYRMHTTLDSVVELWLREAGQPHLFGPLSFCVKELVINAQKANTKRLYFEERGLDARVAEEYARGMESFRECMSTEAARYVGLLKERGRLIRVTFKRSGGELRISVRNDVVISRVELDRAKERIRVARGYGTLSEAFDALVDPSEAAGLGIFMLVGILKSCGIGADSFRIGAERGETVASFAVPVVTGRPGPREPSAN